MNPPIAVHMAASIIVSVEFQSTPPVQGAIDGIELVFAVLVISIHAPRAGSDGKNERIRPQYGRCPAIAKYYDSPNVDDLKHSAIFKLQ